MDRGEVSAAYNCVARLITSFIVVETEKIRRYNSILSRSIVNCEYTRELRHGSFKDERTLTSEVEMSAKFSPRNPSPSLPPPSVLHPLYNGNKDTRLRFSDSSPSRRRLLGALQKERESGEGGERKGVERRRRARGCSLVEKPRARICRRQSSVIARGNAKHNHRWNPIFLTFRADEVGRRGMQDS